MRLRMPNIFMPPNSTNFYYRKTVPECLRARLGKREIKLSLHTTNKVEAALKGGALDLEWDHKFSQLRDELTAEPFERIPQIISQTFTEMYPEKRRGDIVHAMAKLISLMVIQSWGRDAWEKYEAEYAFCLHLDADHWNDASEEIDIVPIEDRQALVGKISSLERSPDTAGMGYRIIVQQILHDRRWQLLDIEVLLFESLSDISFPSGAHYDRAAEAIATIIVEFRQPNWTEGSIAAFAQPLKNDVLDAAPRPAHSVGEQRTVATAIPHQTHAARSTQPTALQPKSEPEHTLLSVYESWLIKRKPSSKLCAEAYMAANRFIALNGNLDIREITVKHIKHYRRVLEGLPSRPKREIAKLDLETQVLKAKEFSLPTLSPPSINKCLMCIRILLAFAVDQMDIIEINPASQVKGVPKIEHDDDRMPFDDSDCAAMFTTPRLKDSTGITTLTLLWILLLGAFTGCRIEELGALRPRNVKMEDGIWFLEIEPDLRRERKKQIKREKSIKTASSRRRIPLHPVLIQAGLTKLAARRASEDAAWLFPDLTADKHGQRTKRVSRVLNSHIRAVGILDTEKVFHSFRHTVRHKLRGKLQKEIVDLLIGHAPADTGGEYGAGAELSVLEDGIKKLVYNSVNWNAYIDIMR